MFSTTWLILLLCTATPNATLTETVTLPLTDGRLHAGQLLGDLMQRVGLDGSTVREQLALTIGVKSTFGQFQLEKITAATDGVVAFEVTPNALLMHIDRLALRRRERELRTRYRELITQWFPQLAQAAAAKYGLRVVNADGQHLLSEIKLPTTVVVLIHGLDEPGNVWNALTPALNDAGFTVCELSYPNDQPIDDSARFIDQQFGLLHRSGVRRAAIVAHSMGGLASRQMLTDPMLYNGQGDRAGRPRVERLIMVGTPNAGSQMARFRLGAEVREQLIRAMSGDGLLFGSVFDGAGEAQLDLLPNSEFLQTLNRKPRPQGVAMTTIGGMASPVNDAQIAKLKNELPTFDFDRWGSALQELSEGVGDGCVSLASSRLDGVGDHVTVEGNHLSMIMNVFGEVDRKPPAVAVVLERLREWRE